MNDFLQRCRALVARVEAAGWTVLEERDIPYGRMIVFTDGGRDKANLSCYRGKKGFRVVTAGKGGDRIAAVLDLAPKEAAKRRADGPDPFELGVPRIGADESGKGDYFGPLVVAAFRVDAEATARLVELGVADSKQLGKTKIERVAGALEDLGGGAVLALDPPDYNERYAARGNLNVLLAELHAACIGRLASRTGGHPPVVVVDRFASRDDVLLQCLELPRSARLVTRAKAEADAAVAAASILARAAFVEGLRRLEHEYGQPFPPGAGTPVLRAGREFVRTFGAARLPEVAKMHFATTQKVT